VPVLVTMFLVHALVFDCIVPALVTMFLVHALVLLSLFHRPCTRHYVPRPCTRIASLSRHYVPRNSLALVVNILFVALMYD
jgi:hypothetical protein